ncbi:MAG: NCS2 family permease [Bacilli bacterium]
MLNKFFKLSAHKTTVRSEVVAGITAFLTVMYIIITNAAILSDAGMNENTAMIATIVVSTLSTFVMGIYSNSPLIVVPGMGINALFSYTLVQGLGLHWTEALAAVTVSGLIVCVLTFTSAANKIAQGIPVLLKQSITVGVGFLILFIGLQKSEIIAHSETTFVALASLRNPVLWISVLTFVAVLTLHIRKVKAAVLVAMVGGTVLAAVLGEVSSTALTQGTVSFQPLAESFGAMNFQGIWAFPFWIGVFALTMVVLFENIGLIHAQLDMTNSPEKMGKSLQTMGVSNIFAGVIGTSPTISAAESIAGIAAGGRTGLTSIVASSLLGCSIILLPLMQTVPNGVIGAILMYIGCLMIAEVKSMRVKDFTDAVPAIVIVSFIPLTFSIVDGIAFGFILYALLKLLTKSEERLSKSMYVVSLCFIVYFLCGVFLNTSH